VKPGRPIAKIDIDGRALTAPESGLVCLTADLALGCHDAVRLSFWRDSKFASAAASSAITIELGTEDESETVFTGEVTGVQPEAGVIWIEALSATAPLSRTRRSQTYALQTAADIVRDLASDVPMDEIEASREIANYSVCGSRTIWWHLLDLSRLSGADVGVSPEGGLRFTPPREGTSDHKFYHGATLLGWHIESRAAAQPLATVPHGAASDAGQNRGHWPQQDPAGSGGPPARVIGAFHTKDSADALNEDLAARAERRTRRGWFTAVGHAPLRPGDLVELKDVPGFSPGLLRTTAVRHSLDGSHGFVTRAAVEGVPRGLGLI
jgi:hypothetical protein